MLSQNPTVAPSLSCLHCTRKFKNASGLTQHMNSQHRPITPPPNEEGEQTFTYERHSILTGKPCNEEGQDLPPFTPPTPKPSSQGSWAPFEDRISFDFAYLHYYEMKSSEGNVNRALDLWAASVMQQGGDGIPWRDAKDLQSTIDEIQHGSIPWKTYTIRYEGPIPPGAPKWMTETYELCCRDARLLLHEQLQTPEFRDKIHYTPYRQFDSEGNRLYSNLLSADWAWAQADQIAQDYPEEAKGAMFVPIVAGSDKTTVSVGTGGQAFHPVYMSPGNITNVARRAHGSGLLPVGFLPIPKVSKHEQTSPEYAKFARQMYHGALACIFKPLKDGMTSPEVVRCPDGHFRRAYYGLGPYIADYPEQVYLAGVVQNWCGKCEAPSENLDADGCLLRSHERDDFLIACHDPGILWSDYGIRCDYTPFTYHFPRADIHELLAPDLLHQIIKGTFKDHIVEWVYDYLKLVHGPTHAARITEDIDRRIAAVPIFPGLRRFKEGRNFEQWTGDDSKALMKIFLACIVGYVPSRMVQCLSAFLDFCYIARQNSISAKDLVELEAAVSRFHEHRQVFIDAGVRETISLPRQHSLKHFSALIKLFGSPNGLCSSITESKHIIAVKKPWRVSSRYKALSQMLRRISREEKLVAAHREFSKQGMMVGSTLSYTQFVSAGGQPTPIEDEGGSEEEDDADDDKDLGPSSGPKVLTSIKLAKIAESGYPTDLNSLAIHINQPHFPAALRRFLWSQRNPDSAIPAHTVPVDECPNLTTRIKVYHSAVARFYAPSDVCGVGGMHHERIRSTPLWQNSYPRRDTAFVETDSDVPGMRGMAIARVLLFFSFNFGGSYFPCAYVHWLVLHGNEPDPETGLWVVKPEFIGGQRTAAVIHLDSVARGAHLLPIFNTTPILADFHFSNSLDAFRAFFVNRHIDHHAYEFVY